MARIRYEEEVVSGQLLLPDQDEPAGFEVICRIDPITGATVRFTGNRPIDPATADRGAPDLTERARITARHCPFCGDRVFSATPRFPGNLIPEGRLIRGEATLFPNLVPYGRYGAVTTLIRDHHLSMGQYTQEILENGFANALDYARRIYARDPEARWLTVTWNLLPSSGAALLHPHLQINIDRRPSGFHGCLARTAGEAAGRSAGSGDIPFLTQLGLDAEKDGRSLGRTGPWTWFTPYAPLGHWEVQAVTDCPGTLADFTEQPLKHLVQGLRKVHRGYASEGKNAANFGLFVSADGAVPLPFFVRTMLRATYFPWYRSDLTAYETVLLDGATDMPPERLATRLRATFQDR